MEQITVEEMLKIYVSTCMVAIINDGQLVRITYDE